MTLHPFALALLLLAAPALAEEHSAAQQIDRRLLELKEALTDQMHELFESRDHESFKPAAKPLGKTLKLEFTLEPVDKDSQKMWVTVATSSYGISAQHKTPAIGFSFEVDGRVKLVGPSQERLHLTYHTALKYHQAGKDNKVDARIQARGSAVVPIGGSTSLARLGEKTLVVQVTEVE